MFVHLLRHTRYQRLFYLWYLVWITFHTRLYQIAGFFLAFLHVSIQPVLKMSHLLGISKVAKIRIIEYSLGKKKEKKGDSFMTISQKGVQPSTAHKPQTTTIERNHSYLLDHIARLLIRCLTIPCAWFKQLGRSGRPGIVITFHCTIEGFSCNFSHEVSFNAV